MIYPLHLVNIEQEGNPRRSRALVRDGRWKPPVRANARRWSKPTPARSVPPSASVTRTLTSLERLQGDLYPNGLWYESPCIESTLAAANIIQDMLLQSWSDPARDEPGPTPHFPRPALGVERRRVPRPPRRGCLPRQRPAQASGRTEWIRIRSLAGEPCRVRPGMDGEIKIDGKGQAELVQVSPGIYQIDLRRGEEVVPRSPKSCVG